MSRLSSHGRQRFVPIFSLALGVGCSAPQRSPQPGVVATTIEASEPLRSAAPPSEQQLRYPPGRWRRAPPGVLGNVMLWPAHILVRHRASLEHEVPFSAVDWKALPLPPQRTREEALVMARQIQARAHADPSKFADLAQQYSEDVTSARDGGALGGINALMLAPWPLLLDALATIKPGDVSKVVESPYGFHVFTLLPPAPAERVSGSHIVIAYDQAPWLYESQGRDDARRRSRQEAIALAEQVYREGTRDPSRFEDLVDRYSDHHDSISGGDFGSWSTHEATPYNREVDALRSLRVKEIGPPRDTFLGIQVLLRTAERDRAILAADLIKIPFAALAPPAQPPIDSGINIAARISNDLEAHPDNFSKWQNQYCCIGSVVWQEGREDPLLTRAVAGLAIGRVSPDVVVTRAGYVIARRAAVPPPFDAGAPAFELPSADTPGAADL